MENKIYELTASNNMKYVAGICLKNKVNGLYEMKVWDGRDMKELSVLFVYFDLGGKRFAVSDDGKYAATAQYEDYEEGNLYVYEVESGKIIFEDNSLRRIQWVMFGEGETIMAGTESKGIYVFDILTGTCKSKIKGNEIYYNRFGENILLQNSKNIKYKGHVFTSSTFTYISAAGTPTGILASEVNGDLYYYGNDGQLNWKSDCLDMGHFIAMYYEKENNTVYGILLNPRKKGDERMHLVTLDENSGETISVSAIETASYVFAEGTEAVMLVNGKGQSDFLDKKRFEK